MKQHDLWTVW